jgi:hypothetical protein
MRRFLFLWTESHQRKLTCPSTKSNKHLQTKHSALSSLPKPLSKSDSQTIVVIELEIHPSR